MKTALKALSVIAAILLVPALGLFGWNHLTLQKPLQRVLDADSRNAGIEANAHYGMYFAPGTLVFDLRRVSPDKAPVDVFRVLLQYSEALKAEHFQLVELAYRGTTKFKLGGDYFHQLGMEYADQNPMYTMRTFAENLLTPDGRPAFDAMDGGALSVFGAQMDQFKEFHQQWYIGSMATP